MPIKNQSIQRYNIRLVNLETGRFKERSVTELTLSTLKHIESRGLIQILDVREGGD